MPDLPVFNNDEEMVEWFEGADLSQVALDEAFGVVVATRVELVVANEPWESLQNSVASGSTANVDFKLDRTPV